MFLIFHIEQNYLREQPDNLKSFNIVGETAQFLNLVYSNITPQNIDLANQLFETLNEFTVVSAYFPEWIHCGKCILPWMVETLLQKDWSNDNSYSGVIKTQLLRDSFTIDTLRAE